MADEQIVQYCPEILYHYCSVPTFYNIIKNKSIWLSDISKSNDSEELQWFFTIFKKRIDDTWNRYLANRRKKGVIDEENAIKEGYNRITNTLESENAKCWGFCLSEKRDDLGQWRGYADNGCGLAIGFKSFYMESMSLLWAGLKDPGEKYQFNPKFDRVQYGSDVLEKLLQNLPDDWANDLSNHSPYAAAHRIKKGIRAMYKFAPFYKNEGFAEEQEWRLVYSANMDTLLMGEKPSWPYPQDTDLCAFHLSNWGHIEKNGALVSHLEFDNPHLEEAIAEVIIGPKCKLTENELKLFLISSGLIKDADPCFIEISKSASSYR